jgi:hypothetical protein
MWSMEYLNFAEKNNRHARTFPLLDVCPESFEQGLNVSP